MALFITFEGGEGSGKSVQAKLLYERLTRLSYKVVTCHEPGGTAFGEYIRNLLKWTDAYISPQAELLMFNVSRSLLLEEVILPSLEMGKVVICDRYTDSTVAYQGYGRGFDLKIIEVINSATTRQLKPDLTILLDIPPEEGLDRVRKRSAPKDYPLSIDRFEREKLAFHRRVRNGYLKMAASEPGRWLVVDARQTKATIAKLIWKRVSQLLDHHSEKCEMRKKVKPKKRMQSSLF